MKVYHVVSALIVTPEEDVLLVRQSRWDRRGDKATGADDDFLWTFPGGKIDPGETREEALVREIKEETGLDVALDAPRYISRCQYTDPSQGWICDVHLYVIREWLGVTEVDDPCGFSLEAKFFPKAEALEHIAMIPWLSMREPLGEYLKGNRNTTDWYYRFGNDGQVVPVSRDEYQTLISNPAEFSNL